MMDFEFEVAEGWRENGEKRLNYGEGIKIPKNWQNTVYTVLLRGSYF